MKLTNRHRAILAITIATIIWGAAAPIFKWSLQEIPPYTLGFLRFILAAILILPFIYKDIAIKKSDFSKLLTLAAFGMLLGIGLLFVGLQLTSSINVPILAAISPILLIVGSAWYLHEKTKRRFIFGSIVSLVGILIIVIEPLLITGPDGSIPGNLLILLSILAGVVYTILLKKYNLPYPALTIVFWTFLLGSMLFLPSFITELVLFDPFSHFDAKSWVGIGFGAIFSSAIAYFLFTYGIKYITASESGIFIYIEPIITILIAIPLLNEIIHPTYIVGSIIVFAGVFIAEAHRHHHHHLHALKHKEPEKA